jgi:phage shock protein C
MTTPTNTKPARLYRSRDDRMIAGIAGGLGKYLGIDPVLVRLAIVVLIMAGGAGILAYIIGWFIIPEEPYPGAAAESDPDRKPVDRPIASMGPRIVVGIVLIAIGASLLLKWAIPSFAHVFWPIIVIAAGAGLLLSGARR